MAYQATMEASQEPNSQQSSVPDDARETDGPASANGSQGGMPDGNQSEEASKMDVQTNGDAPVESLSNGETETQVPSNNQDGTLPESEQSEDKTE